MSLVKTILTKIRFNNGSQPAINDTNLNQMQTNIQTAISTLEKNIDTEIGKIIESGSNANGSYIKWSDGTMICYKNFSGTVKITESWYSLYETGSANALDFGNYPQEFKETPLLFTQFYGGNPQWIDAWLDNTRTASKVGKAIVCSASSKTAGAYYNIIAIGKWK